MTLIKYLFVFLLFFIGCSGSDGNSQNNNNNNNNPPPLQSTQFNNVTGTHLNSNALSDNTMDGEAVDIDNDGDIDLILAMEFRRNRICLLYTSPSPRDA